MSRRSLNNYQKHKFPIRYIEYLHKFTKLILANSYAVKLKMNIATNKKLESYIMVF